jgi:hypothetical protein
MAFSAYLADKVLVWVKGTAFPSALTNVYVSLHSADPGTAGTTSDVTASIKGSAARTAIAAADFSGVGAASGGGFQITNSNVVQFTTNAANGSTITVTHFGLWDASTGGNFLASGSLSASVDVATGDTVQFNTAALAVRVV